MRPRCTKVLTISAPPKKEETPAGLALEPIDLLADVVADDPGVPFGVLHGLREDDLGHRAPDSGVLGHESRRLAFVSSGPEGRHALVHSPAVQECVRAVELIDEKLLDVGPG
jgi:hypothetical protein